MRYVPTSIGKARQTFTSEITPKILGTYEKELHPIFEELKLTPPSYVVDIGAAEGYYAVGCARLFQIAVSAFEMDAASVHALRRTARANRVDDLVKHCGSCDVSALRAELSRPGRPLVICDVDGYEEVLMDPTAVPELEKCDILVETHDFLGKDLTKIIQMRFSGTHSVTCIEERPRGIADFPSVPPFLNWFSERYITTALDEARPAPQKWLYLRALSIRHADLASA